METLAAGIWRSLSTDRPDALLIAYGGSNRRLPGWLPVALARASWLLLRRRVEAVLVGDALMYAVMYPVLKIFRVPHATMVMGLDLTYQNRAYRVVVHRILRRAPRVIAISTATAELARSFGVPADRVGVVRLGVSGPDVTPEDRVAAAKAIRHRYDLPDDAIVLLTLGRLVRRKGVRWFVEHVLPGLPGNVLCLVVGEGPDAEPIRAAVARAGIADRVRLLGRVDGAQPADGWRGGLRPTEHHGARRHGGLRSGRHRGGDTRHDHRRERHRRAAGRGARWRDRDPAAER